MSDQNQGASIEAERAAPCPFCKSRGTEIHKPGELFYVHCDGCDAEGPISKTRAGALKAWNRRTPAATTGELPKKMSWLDAPHDIQNDHANAWSKGWNACRAAIEADRAQRKQAALQELIDIGQEIEAGAKGQGEPVACAHCAGKGQVKVSHIPGGWAKCGECGGHGRIAAPASAQPADEMTADEARAALKAMPLDQVVSMVRGAQPDQRESAAVPMHADEHTRYRFLLSFLLDRGVLHRYGNGIWRLRGIYGVDDSGLKGAGRTPEEALDNAIIAVNLDPVSAEKFWRESCDEVLSSGIAADPSPAAQPVAKDEHITNGGKNA